MDHAGGVQALERHIDEGVVAALLGLADLAEDRRGMDAAVARYRADRAAEGDMFEIATGCARYP